MDNVTTCAWDSDCPRPVSARGLCNTHYMRAKRAGTIDQWKAPQRHCYVCDELFDITKHRKSCCSDECTKRSNGHRFVVNRLKTLPERSCDQCRASIDADRRRDARFCSIECQQAAWYDRNQERLRQAAREWASSNRELRNEYHHRREARKLGLRHEVVNPASVWERDAGQCYLCEQEVTPDRRFPDPRSPSMDHVIPLDLGGAHAFDNIALTHLRCNLSKKNRLPQRFPLWHEGVTNPLAVATKSA